MTKPHKPVDLIVAVDDKLDDDSAWDMSPGEKRDRLRNLYIYTLDDLTGLTVPISGAAVQVKINTVLRAIGHEAFELAEEAGVDVFADYKMPAEVLDTLYADIRAIMGYACIKRLTFRVENQVEFLAGRTGKSGWEKGACELMPHTSFLPVGPVTDLPKEYYLDRMGLLGGRSDAIDEFEQDVKGFGDYVGEVICGPKDIPLFDNTFWNSHAPITPAVRPIDLGGNEANNTNAFDVAKAIAAGSRGLVIGSPIMGAKMGRRKATELVISQMNEYFISN